MATTPKNQNLQELIRDRILDRSYAQLARDCGFTNRAIIQRLATKDLRDIPTTETLKGLAVGLQVRVGQVIAACAVSVGLDPLDIGSSDLVIKDARILPPGSQNLILSMADHLLSWNEGTVLGSKSAPVSNLQDYRESKNSEQNPVDHSQMAASHGDSKEPRIDPEQLPDH